MCFVHFHCGKRYKGFRGVQIQTEIDSARKSGGWEGCTHNSLSLVFAFLIDFHWRFVKPSHWPFVSFFLLSVFFSCLCCIVLVIPESLASSFRIWSFLRWIWEETSSLELLPSEAYDSMTEMENNILTCTIKNNNNWNGSILKFWLILIRVIYNLILIIYYLYMF